MYHIQDLLNQKTLTREIFPWLGNLLQLEQTTWVIKIQGRLFIPRLGDSVFTWPQEDQEEESQLRQYCREVEEVNLFLPNLTVAVEATPLLSADQMGENSLLQEFHQLQ